MKRLTRYSLIVLLVLLPVLAAAAFVTWVTATSQGSRWLLKSIPSLTGVSFSARTIEGKISDRLLLNGVRLIIDRQRIEIDRVELRWKPLLLLTGTVGIKRLTLNGVRVQDNTPADDKPPLLEWPRVSQRARLLNGVIERLQVTGLNYRRLNENTLTDASMTASISWEDGALTLNELAARSAAVLVNGSLSAGFVHPSLAGDLTFSAFEPVSGMDRLQLRLRPGKSAGDESLAASVTLEGNAGTKKLLELSGDVGMAGKAINLRRLRLNRTGQKGEISGDGSLDFQGNGPILGLRIGVTSLDLAPQLKSTTNISGTITFTGNTDSYRGTLKLNNNGDGWRTLAVTAAYKGNMDGLKLAPIAISALDGSLAGNLHFDWRNGFTVTGDISGRNLNPARFDPQWEGLVNFNASGSFGQDRGNKTTGTIRGVLLDSRLHGHKLTGELQADISGDNILLSSLNLHGKGFDLQASGDLTQRLAFDARITDASRLVPHASGSIRAGGWLRWRDQQLSGAVTGTGKKLAFAGTSVATANLNAHLYEGAAHPFKVSATLLELTHEQYGVQAINLSAQGTLQQHKIDATLSSGRASAHLTVEAGYNAGAWSGELSRLAGRDGVGPWTMIQPTRFSISSKQIILAPTRLTSGATEHLEIGGNLTMKPLLGEVSARWNNLDIARFNQWLPHGTSLKGRISGQSAGTFLPDKRFTLDGNAELSGGTLLHTSPEGEFNIALASAKASWGWRGEKLDGTIEFVMTEYGKAHGSFQLTIPAVLPLAVNSRGRIQGTLVGQAREKGMVTALFPKMVQESFGEMNVNINLGGTWEQPDITGKLKLARAGAYLPTAGIHLKDIELAARLQKDQIWIDSFRAVSGPGYLEGTALITLKGTQVTAYRGTINGENFQTVHLPELQVQVTPKLTFAGDMHKLSVRGDLLLPEVQIAASQSRNVIAPSNDVILEGREPLMSHSNLPTLDVRIRVHLGEQVFVKVGGIDAQLGGTVDLSFNRLDSITSAGEIKVIKGRYQTYGVNLEIVRGRLFFAGVPMDSPTLDFLALRTIGDVQAGVTVAGTLKKPVTKLYSKPAMPDVDILAYIVLGHPLGSSGEQAGIVAQAAGALLTSGQAVIVERQIKNYLGLNTLEIQSGIGVAAPTSTYKPLQPSAVQNQQAGVSETILTVGKYLTPQLYISYGKSLFSGSNLFRLRYDIYKQWQIETQTGSESGVDLFYKLEFK